tara:strand:+ start:172372 stop:173895 length:1524 start_codon:yes stop_codon:yes gene_type:complete
MEPNKLEEILNCPSLPSLPAVAIRVLELTSDPDVKMDELAKEIQFDQGISAKILRTVNSSFYGLRKRCSSIEHALVMLGLGPVKSLVLGFSLVSITEGKDSDGFNYLEYWERGLTTAVAAKYAAEMVNNKKICDEAFLSGLFQDIGMIAMHRAIGPEYLRIIEQTEGDHAKLAKFELDSLEIQHTTVSALLCESWKIPHEIVIPVRYHDHPTACPQEFSQTTRCVGFGNMIHAVLSAENPTEQLRRTYSKGSSWLGLNESQIDELIKKSGETAKELGNLFSIDVGSIPNPDEVLAKADRQLIEMSKNQQIEGYAAKQFAELVQADDDSDPITGAMGREGFTVAVREAFHQSHSGQFSLSIVQMLINGFEELGKSVGESAQDEVIIGVSVLLRRQFEHMGGIVCRLSDSIFAVVLPSVNRAEATQGAQACCDEFSKRVSGWIPETEGIEGLIQVAIGVASVDDESRMIMKTPELLVQASGRAVVAAKANATAGKGSAVRAFVPRIKAA